MLTLEWWGSSISTIIFVEIMLSSKSISKNCLTISLHSLLLTKLMPLRRSLQSGSFLMKELSTDSLISSSSYSLTWLAACGTPIDSGTFFLRKNLIWRPPFPSSNRKQSKRFKLSVAPSLIQMWQMNNWIRRSTKASTIFTITYMRRGNDLFLYIRQQLNS